MENITLMQYFGPYQDEATPSMRANALALLGSVNGALVLAQLGGVDVLFNPKTGSYISGEGNGGFRGVKSTVGAANSRHRRAMAVDIYDPLRHLAAWAVQHRNRLIELGILGMERPEWTPTWVHWQIEWVRSKTWCYVPSAEPPIATALPEQKFLAME